jgi:hypothetical protein
LNWKSARRERNRRRQGLGAVYATIKVPGDKHEIAQPKGLRHRHRQALRKALTVFYPGDQRDPADRTQGARSSTPSRQRQQSPVLIESTDGHDYWTTSAVDISASCKALFDSSSTTSESNGTDRKHPGKMTVTKSNLRLNGKDDDLWHDNSLRYWRLTRAAEGHRGAADSAKVDLVSQRITAPSRFTNLKSRVKPF